MLVHNNPGFRIYFGNKQDNLFQDHYLATPADQRLLDHEPYAHVGSVLGLQEISFLHQTHSDQGLVITSQQQAHDFAPFRQEGDYLITSVAHSGIGVMTADCVPLVLYDSFSHVVAVVHAGWKGAANRVAVKALQQMQKEFGTQLNTVQIFIGPSIGHCCYQVQSDFIKNMEHFSFAETVLHAHGGNLYFDLPLCNRLQLQEIGVPKEAFHLQYNLCTMCDESFWSYRREGKLAGRQMTVATLV